MFRSLSPTEIFSDIAGLGISLGFQQSLSVVVKHAALRNTALEARPICVTRARMGAVFISRCVDTNHGSDSSLMSRVCAKSLQSCLSLCNPIDCSLPDCSVHRILQARTLKWVPFPTQGSNPHFFKSPALACGFFIICATWQAPLLYHQQPNLCLTPITFKWNFSVLLTGNLIQLDASFCFCLNNVE